MQNVKWGISRSAAESRGWRDGTFWHHLALFGTAFSARAGCEEHTEVNRRGCKTLPFLYRGRAFFRWSSFRRGGHERIQGQASGGTPEATGETLTVDLVTPHFFRQFYDKAKRLLPPERLFQHNPVDMQIDTFWLPASTTNRPSGSF
jgi:hypothetical protein